MSELADYLRPAKRSWCAACRAYVRVVRVDGWSAEAYCHRQAERRTFSLSFIEDNPKKVIAWFELQPRFEFRDRHLDRHGRTP